MAKDRQLYVLIVNRILKLMGSRGLNPHRLSVMIDKDPAYVRDLVRGLDDSSKAGIPKLDTLKALAKAFPTTIDYLLGETDDESVDAADLVPKTSDQKYVLTRMKGLSDSEQERARRMIDLAFPNLEDGADTDDTPAEISP